VYASMLFDVCVCVCVIEIIFSIIKRFIMSKDEETYLNYNSNIDHNITN